ncbi:D-alanine--D-alanine ligase [Streptomyces sp. RB17]|uniref:ATP-grasp domain-containing protein n=1 Tax=Streptomyces sp. RB17 TaxID=2585197 RepID=UPI00129668A6|nr:ATP-grasp domain-containing protein [Streptomyces sp. RB17]MQY35025.1 D-alanine--D-alanine ligase [Streptomyces sp. RB17]
MTTDGPTPDDGLILVVGSGVQRYREYLLSSAGKHPVWLLDAAEPGWQLAHVTGHTVVPQLHPERMTPDVPALVEAARQVAAERPVAGVMSYDETLVVATAHIAEALELPGLTVAGALNCRDKSRTRALLTQAGLVQPGFAFVTDLAAAREAAAGFGYPVVVKPRGMGASIGVVRVEDEAALDSAFATAEQAGRAGNPDFEGGVLVEEMLTGPEISIDGAVLNGEYRPMFVAHKSVGLEPYFEETGHTVSADDPLLTDPVLLDTLERAHRALGVSTGMTHTEVKFSSRGPAIVEVNARLGGDLIPYVGRLATGIDPADVAVETARGRAADLTPARIATVGIRFCYPPVDGTVAAVTLPAPGSTPGLLEAEQITPDGAALRLPPGGYANLSRYALLVGEGPDPESCAAVLDAAQAASAVRLT